MFVCGWSGKQEKQWFPLPYLLPCKSLVSVKENTNKKREKKEERKKKKYGYNANQTDHSSR